MTTNQDPRQTAIRYGTRRAAETNAMRFATAILADRSRNFTRTAPRTTSRRKTVR